MRLDHNIDVDLFREQGFVILPDILDDDELATLCDACDALLSEPPDDDNGGKGHNIGRGHSRRFLRHRHMDFDGLRDFVLGAEMKHLVSNFLPDGVILFNEQFVVKAANTGASFGWHQDGGYIPFDHDPYVTVWIALDDTTVENGAVFLLPRSPDDTATPVKHWWNEDGKEYVGYDGPDPGIPAEVSAGSIVIFSSLTLHRSSPNVTDRQRRGYVVQYAGAPIIDPSSGEVRGMATSL